MASSNVLRALYYKHSDQTDLFVFASSSFQLFRGETQGGQAQHPHQSPSITTNHLPITMKFDDPSPPNHLMELACFLYMQCEIFSTTPVGMYWKPFVRVNLRCYLPGFRIRFGSLTACLDINICCGRELALSCTCNAKSSPQHPSEYIGSHLFASTSVAISLPLGFVLER